MSCPLAYPFRHDSMQPSGWRIALRLAGTMMVVSSSTTARGLGPFAHLMSKRIDDVCIQKRGRSRVKQRAVATDVAPSAADFNSFAQPFLAGLWR